MRKDVEVAWIDEKNITFVSPFVIDHVQPIDRGNVLAALAMLAEAKQEIEADHGK